MTSHQPIPTAIDAWTAMVRALDSAIAYLGFIGTFGHPQAGSRQQLLSAIYSAAMRDGHPRTTDLSADLDRLANLHAEAKRHVIDTTPDACLRLFRQQRQNPRFAGLLRRTAFDAAIEQAELMRQHAIAALASVDPILTAYDCEIKRRVGMQRLQEPQ